jgi:hypothetical protein
LVSATFHRLKSICSFGAEQPELADLQLLANIALPR